MTWQIHERELAGSSVGKMAISVDYEWSEVNFKQYKNLFL